MQIDEPVKAVWDNPVTGTGLEIIKSRRNKPLNKASAAIWLTLVSLTLLTIYGLISFDYKNINILESFAMFLENSRKMFLEAHLKHFSLADAFYELFVTIGLTVLTTLLGGFLALFLALFAARNLSSARISNLVRAIMAFIRAVPTVLWVLIFAVAAGLGSVAAVIGMTFHSLSYLVKAYSESFEELDKGVIEALKGSGANWWQIVFQAVIPTSVTYLLSWTFLRFEINFTIAVAMGAAAGAGGIGFDLYMASGHYMDLREVGIITYFILAVAVVLEIIATKMKIRLKEFN